MTKSILIEGKGDGKGEETSPLRAAAPVALRVPEFKRVNLSLVGCGGTGSHIASGLASIVMALQERSIEAEVMLVDPDRVEEKNVGRQLFSIMEIGMPKAEALAERMNAAYGLRFGAAVRGIDVLDIESTGRTTQSAMNEHALFVVIGAVDNPAARAIMAKAVQESQGRLWWLDCGNENHSGQVGIGNVAQKSAMRGAIALGMVDRIPSPSVVWPDLVTHAKTQRRKGKTRVESCAELTAAGEQSLMINRMMAGWACSMLHDFLVTRDLRYFSIAVDLQWGGVQALTIDAPTIARACGLRVDEVMVKEAEHGKARATQNH